jgi:inner membrane protein
MEPITQGLLGAATGDLAAGRALGRRALVWGALVGMSPDLDVLAAPLYEGYGEWLHHRGTTHSLWFGFAVGPAVGWLLWRWRDRARETQLRAWVALSIVALVTHPILDGFTPYGTQLFAPFSRERFAWNGVGIVDPFFSVLLAAGVAAAASRLPQPVRRRSLQASLALSTLYLFGGVAWNAHAERAVRADLEAAGARIERLDVYPTVLQPWLRFFVAHAGDRVLLGWHTPAAPDCLTWVERAVVSENPRTRALLETWEGRLLTWFADGHVGIEEEERGGGTVVFADDLRYAWGSGTGRGMWGVAARFDAQDRLVGKVRRFSRARGRDADELFGAMAGRLPARGAWKTLPACLR